MKTLEEIEISAAGGGEDSDEQLYVAKVDSFFFVATGDQTTARWCFWAAGEAKR